MAEVLPRHLVGPVLMASQMCSMLGSLAIAILSFDEIFATPELWPTIVGEFRQRSSPLLFLSGTVVVKREKVVPQDKIRNSRKWVLFLKFASYVRSNNYGLRKGDDSWYWCRQFFFWWQVSTVWCAFWCSSFYLGWCKVRPFYSSLRITRRLLWQVSRCFGVQLWVLYMFCAAISSSIFNYDTPRKMPRHCSSCNNVYSFEMCSSAETTGNKLCSRRNLGTEGACLIQK